MSGEEEEDLVMPKLQVIQNISYGSYKRRNDFYRSLRDSFARKQERKANRIITLDCKNSKKVEL